MTYRIHPQRSLPKEVRRIAVEELDAAIALLSEPDVADPAAGVHTVRKGIKRVRSLGRLVRAGLGREFGAANRSMREASALLSPMRDAHAVLGAFDAVVRAEQRRMPTGGVGALRAALAERASGAHADERVGEITERAVAALRTAREQVAAWSPPNDLRVAIGGAADSYRAGRRAFRRSIETPDEVHLHEWRKRIKDGWHHADLLHELAPHAMKAERRWLGDLGDGLGDIHDLFVLGAVLDDAGDELPSDQRRLMTVVIEDLRGELIDRCHRSGARLYVDDRHARRERLQAYAKARRRAGKERKVGTIGDVFGAASPDPSSHTLSPPNH